jgi:hypothetical protein
MTQQSIITIISDSNKLMQQFDSITLLMYVQTSRCFGCRDESS